MRPKNDIPGFGGVRDKVLRRLGLSLLAPGFEQERLTPGMRSRRTIGCPGWVGLRHRGRGALAFRGSGRWIERGREWCSGGAVGVPLMMVFGAALGRLMAEF
jgi:hypothetical protein